jgi:hypothetical protein
LVVSTVIVAAKARAVSISVGQWLAALTLDLPADLPALAPAGSEIERCTSLCAASIKSSLQPRGVPAQVIFHEYQSQRPRWPIPNLGMTVLNQMNVADQPLCNGPFHLSFHI